MNQISVGLINDGSCLLFPRLLLSCLALLVASILSFFTRICTRQHQSWLFTCRRHTCGHGRQLQSRFDLACGLSAIISKQLLLLLLLLLHFQLLKKLGALDCVRNELTLFQFLILKRLLLVNFCNLGIFHHQDLLLQLVIAVLTIVVEHFIKKRLHFVPIRIFD